MDWRISGSNAPSNSAVESGRFRLVHWPLSSLKQSIVTLDMEGVLTPEIWIAVAEHTRVPELRRTTRDEPDYDKLMHFRIDLMARHRIALSQIQAVIARLGLLPGALDFLNE